MAKLRQVLTGMERVAGGLSVGREFQFLVVLEGTREEIGFGSL